MSVDWKRWESDLLARAERREERNQIVALEIKRQWQKATPRPMLWWEWCIWIGWAVFLVGFWCFELFR